MIYNCWEEPSEVNSSKETDSNIVSVVTIVALKELSEWPYGLSFQVGGLEAPLDTNVITEPNQTKKCC